MIFPSIEFALFFAIVLPLNWALMPYPRAWKPFIIGASYVFYAYAGWQFVFCLIGSTLWNQAFAHAITRTRGRDTLQRLLLALALAGDLGLLGWFKYYGFFVSNVVAVTTKLGLPMPLPLIQMLPPIAISFFTFMAMSYVIDVFRGTVAPIKLIDFAAYLSFFPHLISGPIVRVTELVPQFASPRNPRRIELARAFGLIAGGLALKVMIAEPIRQQLVDPVFGSPSLHSRIDVIAAVYGYAIEIYCDFAGYTDIAIGLALLLGYQFPQNFNRPYIALTLQDFWHRWHMSLSRWLRDYLYIGLGGNRKGPRRTYVNLMLTMLLGGLWHGAAWNFVIWGGLHGSGLAVERWWQDRTGRRESRLPWLRWLLTFNFVCLAWVFFRAPDLSTVRELAGQVVSDGPTTVLSTPILLLIGAGLIIQFLPRGVALQARLAFARLGPVGQGVCLGIVLFLTGVLVTGQGVAPFIYYRF